MIKNNKGFMLAEVIITSTIVLTSLVGLYATFNRLYSLHKVRETYYNVDGMYAIKGIMDEMISSTSDTCSFNTVISKFGDDKISDNLVSCSGSYGSSYNIKSVYLLKYEDTSLNTLKDEEINQTFKDYIDFVKKRYNFVLSESGKYDYEYLMLIEYGSSIDNTEEDEISDDWYYSSMGIG